MNQNIVEVSDLAVLISIRIDDLAARKNQREIAFEVGYNNPNIISLIKSGATKLSLDRVESMAKALDIDVAPLMRAALRQYYDEATISVMERALGQVSTKTESDILAIARSNMDTRQNLSFATLKGLAWLFRNNKPVKLQ